MSRVRWLREALLLSFTSIRFSPIYDNFQYTWHPSADVNEESYILAYIRSSYSDDVVPDCPFVPDDFVSDKKSKSLNKALLALIILGAIFIAIVIGLLFYCLLFYRIVRFASWWNSWRRAFRWVRYLLLRRRFADESFKSKKTYTSVYKSESRYPKNQPVRWGLNFVSWKERENRTPIQGYLSARLNFINRSCNKFLIFNLIRFVYASIE